MVQGKIRVFLICCYFNPLRKNLFSKKNASYINFTLILIAWTVFLLDSGMFREKLYLDECPSEYNDTSPNSVAIAFKNYDQLNVVYHFNPKALTR